MLSTNLNPKKSSNEKASKQSLSEDRKKFLIKQALLKVSKPLSRRELSILCPMEICTLCHPLLDLVKTGVLYIAYKRACASTGNPVFHYALSSWKESADDSK